jgi:hypothetical protein
VPCDDRGVEHRADGGRRPKLSPEVLLPRAVLCGSGSVRSGVRGALPGSLCGSLPGALCGSRRLRSGLWLRAGLLLQVQVQVQVQVPLQVRTALPKLLPV